MLDLVEEFRALLQAFERRSIEFAVCGGLAMAIHARPRATLAVDLLVRPAALEEARRAARALGYTLEAGPFALRKDVVEIYRLSKADPETGDLLSLDLLVVTPALAEVWSGRERIGWEHGTVPVVSRAGLVAMKRLRDSGQDRDDIRVLEAEDGDG